MTFCIVLFSLPSSPQASTPISWPKIVNLFLVGVMAGTLYGLNCWNCVEVRSLLRAVMLCLSSRPDPVSSAQDNEGDQIFSLRLFSFCLCVTMCLLMCGYSSRTECRHSAYWMWKVTTVSSYMWPYPGFFSVQTRSWDTSEAFFF